VHNSATDADVREHALKRLKKRRDFYRHVFTYVIINGMLVVIWATWGGGGFFWPIFPITFWGLGVVMNWWDVFYSEFNEGRIQREIVRIQHRGTGRK
jgi:hypothetical protein